MWLLRLLAVILIVTLGVSFLVFLITGNRVYLSFCWRLLRYGVLFALIVFGLMIIERVAVMV
jgi:hypothetical protein